MTNTPPRNRARTRAVLLQLIRAAMFVGVVLMIHHVRARELDRAAAGPPSELSLELLREFYPGAATLGEYNVSSGGFIILDAGGEPLGVAVQTAPLSNGVVGYSGPTNVLICFDAEDRILGTAILHSEDTEEHVRAVKGDARFLLAWNGLDRSAALALADVDAVSGSTLTSYAVRESLALRLGGKRPSLKFPDPVAIDEARRFFPDAVSLDPAGSRIEVQDATGAALGFVVRTSPHGDAILGYQGPTDSLLAFDRDGKLIGFAVRHSYDNVPYVGYLSDDYSFPSIFKGKSLVELATFDLDAEQVEGISGATMTSMAVARTFVETGRRVSRETETSADVATKSWRLAPRDAGTLAILVGGCAMSFTRLRGKTWLRRAWLVTLVVYLGFLNGDMVSQAFLAGAARNGFPWASAFGLCCLTIAACAIPLVSHHQVYCHQICPHGAAQQLLKRRLRRHWSIPKVVQRVLLIVPAILLCVALLAALRVVTVNLANLEAFDAYLFTIAGWGSLGIAIVGLVASLFVPMAYCRFGCPTGALLNWLRWNARSDRWSPRDWFALTLLIAAGFLALR